jgi:hypothetical protein
MLKSNLVHQTDEDQRFIFEAAGARPENGTLYLAGWDSVGPT